MLVSLVEKRWKRMFRLDITCVLKVRCMITSAEVDHSIVYEVFILIHILIIKLTKNIS
jgi:hypothetical protein